MKRSLFYMLLLPCMLLAQQNKVFLEKKRVKDSIIERQVTLKQLEQEYGPMLEARINVDKRIRELKDSLRARGVDTFLVLKKSYNSWRSDYKYYTLNKGKLEPVMLRSLGASEPAYLFWVKNKTCFVKKVDQFRNYNTCQNPVREHYHLYDFYYRNKTALANEKTLDVYTDTLKKAHYNSSKGVYEQDNEIKKENYIYYPLDMSSDYAGTRSTSLSFSTRTDSLSFGFYDQELKAMVNYDKTGTRYGNDSKYYYQNQMLLRNLWIKLVESEVLRLETYKLW